MATIEDVKAAAIRCRDRVDRDHLDSRSGLDAVKGVLATFGVSCVADLPEDQYDKAVRRFDDTEPPRVPRSGYSEGGDMNAAHCVCCEGRDRIQKGEACWPGYEASNTGPVMFMGYPDIPESPPEYVLVTFCPWCGRRPKA